MRSLGFLTLSGCIVGPSLGFAPPSPFSSSSPPSYSPAVRNVVCGGSATTRLCAAPEPLATEGAWSAYLDDETTGYVYYFNGVTGESAWEPPTETFPAVDAAATTPGAATATAIEDPPVDEREARREARRAERSVDDREARKEARRAERQKRREERKREKKEESEVGGGFFGALFGGGGGGAAGGRAAEPTGTEPIKKTKTEQLSDLSKIASNDAFLSDIDSVIAEAEAAIAIAEKVEEVEEVEEAPPKSKGGFENIFSQFGFGADSGPATEQRREPEPAAAEEEPEENVWVEGLKGLFQKTFDSFIPPETTKNPVDKKVVAVDATPKEKKAEVSDSDFLDVVWGAETSARPTLNIAEMMKAFQTQSKDDEESPSAASEEFRTLALDVAVSVKPHPEKVSWGGEDAGFYTGRTFGVFDGVSGAEKEEGKKLYSRSLADSMKKSSSRAGGLSVKDITQGMDDAKAQADGVATGASTAVVASVGEDNVLRALNIGDSVCLVLRDGAVAARTREIIHYFDCPYQLGDDSPDRPRDGTTLQSEIFAGDVIVAGSDGVFDNLSDADVIEIVGSFGPRTRSSAIAKRIVEQSRSVSLDPEAVTPYSTVARGKRGYDMYKSGRGGKVDDIGCIVVQAK